MGFLDKIKAAKNYITGGGAEVTVQLADEPASFEKPLVFHSKVVVKDADLKVDKVYLKIRSQETSEAYCNDAGRTVSNHTTTHKEEFVVAENVVMEAGKTYEYTTEVDLSGDLQGTYNGVNAWHEWAVYVGLDVSGNDPDSNWQTFELY